jgi:A/G-specific adenine glycosylase
MRRRLLRWYDNNRRDLPWRRTEDPYAIWIAETMLQQTQVQTVLPYYERFMKSLPSVLALHRASTRKVLALWSGLGYYRRAENLKKAAREIFRKYSGEIPTSYESLRSLPGIGDYTAGAVMSVAFGQPFPAVDGNVRRVLSRIFSPKTEAELRRISRQVVPRIRPGDFNQALMDLGATICVPQNPTCGECPIASDCAGRLSILPPPRNRGSRVRNIDWPLALVRSNGKILLRRRAAQAILPGLWEFPGGAKARCESLGAVLRRHLRDLNGAVKPEFRIGEFRHSITNRRISSPVFLFSIVSGATLRLPNRQWRWFTPASLDRYPISAMTRKAIGLLQAYDESSR